LLVKCYPSLLRRRELPQRQQPLPRHLLPRQHSRQRPLSQPRLRRRSANHFEGVPYDNAPSSHLLGAFDVEAMVCHEHSLLPQVGSFWPVRAARIMAAAHPTPLSTVIAPVGQLSWQAPHSMHASGRTSWARRLFMANTAWGQTMTHSSQPIHTGARCG
jgi:hypothetical protein